jgi:FtsZ-binding cell division protein ZapB
MQQIIDEFNAVQMEIERLKREAERQALCGGANRSERRQAEKLARRQAKKQREKVAA